VTLFNETEYFTCDQLQVAMIVTLYPRRGR